MMKMKKALLFVMTGVIAAFAPTQADAQRPGGMGLRQHITALEIPGLTKQQREKIEEIRLSHAREALDFNNTIAEKNAALRTLTQQDDPDMQQINHLLEEIYDLRLELAKNRVQSQLQIRQELTDEQKLFFDMRSRNLSGFSIERFQNRGLYRGPVERTPQRRGIDRPRPGIEGQ
jgi:Spy/CpxP family protein refolding chaperone